ncbi:hypothetical protein X271_00540 [Candidatus Hepatoplasma crinochetorum Av]|uniref:Uncharacterized protein n=1 Tax=Candidatus Hepatoplasma crinochetorum Av TaxID=1427984 RepID=W8GT84_9MOLU|nr:hypothetical protein X271_00540 [Candidatus Hepatoplasma crinochetorum Av]
MLLIFINIINIDMLVILVVIINGFYVKQPKINIFLIKEMYDKTKNQ